MNWADDLGWLVEDFEPQPSRRELFASVVDAELQGIRDRFAIRQEVELERARRTRERRSGINELERIVNRPDLQRWGRE